MKIKGEYVLREIAGDYILIPIGETALEMNGMITMNEVGVTIWKAIERGADEEEILQELVNTFEVEEAEARNDMQEYITKLKENGLVK